MFFLFLDKWDIFNSVVKFFGVIGLCIVYRFGEKYILVLKELLRIVVKKWGDGGIWIWGFLGIVVGVEFRKLNVIYIKGGWSICIWIRLRKWLGWYVLFEVFGNLVN